MNRIHGAAIKDTVTGKYFAGFDRENKPIWDDQHRALVYPNKDDLQALLHLLGEGPQLRKPDRETFTEQVY